MERTNTKDIVSKVAYLIGVKKTVLYNQFETERPGYLKELDENQNARTIRSLCKLRMTLLHRFKKIDDMLRFELKNLKTIEFFDKDDIKQLEKWEIPVILVNSRSSLSGMAEMGISPQSVPHAEKQKDRCSKIRIFKIYGKYGILSVSNLYLLAASKGLRKYAVQR